MIRKRLHILFFLGFVALVSLPTLLITKLRISCITLIAAPKKTPYSSEEFELLKTQNQLLHLQVHRLKEWLFQEKKLENQAHLLFALAEKHDEPFFRRRQDHLQTLLNAQLCALPAKVIFREPSAWSNVIWINVGHKDNKAVGSEIIAKNSPVVLGKAVVGVIEMVTETKSQVRLITDRALSLSVRAVRGGEHERVLSEELNHLIDLLTQRKDLKGAEDLALLLTRFQEEILYSKQYLYLAKGELHGTGAPLWRALSQKLEGVGFNYDIPDQEGKGELKDPLLKVGDLLVTTGMDGIFPPDFHVATVSHISPAREGENRFNLQAQAVVPNLNSLSEVFVLPPQF